MSAENDQWLDGFTNGDLKDLLSNLFQVSEEPEFSLKILGILWCSGDISEKASQLVKLITNDGQKLASNSSKLRRVFTEVVYLSGIFTYNSATESTKDTFTPNLVD